MRFLSLCFVFLLSFQVALSKTPEKSECIRILRMQKSEIERSFLSFQLKTKYRAQLLKKLLLSEHTPSFPKVVRSLEEEIDKSITMLKILSKRHQSDYAKKCPKKTSPTSFRRAKKSMACKEKILKILMYKRRIEQYGKENEKSEFFVARMIKEMKETKQAFPKGEKTSYGEINARFVRGIRRLIAWERKFIKKRLELQKVQQELLSKITKGSCKE